MDILLSVPHFTKDIYPSFAKQLPNFTGAFAKLLFY